LIAARNRDEFVTTFGHLFEHSPWVVERAWDKRPFPDERALHGAFMAVVAEAGRPEQLALIRAHPELGMKAVDLTEASDSEQSGAGLKHLREAEFERFAALNAAYRGKFGFPFIICVRQHSKTSILAAFEQRLLNDEAAETSRALAEIGAITFLRLNDMKAMAEGAGT
jgi:2-oxo-4-hydroxy-4-carboxy-5-ureidoimidazoline decarboxylase